MNSFTIEARDGLSLTLRSWLPDGETKAVVQVVHGMLEHGQRYERLALFLNTKGIALFAHDQRGHGAACSDEDYGHMGDSDISSSVRDDIQRITAFIKKEHPDLPLILMGHSMGSFYVQYTLIDDATPYAGVILSGSNRPIGALGKAARLLARGERKRLGKRAKSAVLDTLSFGSFNKPFKPARTPMDWLSRDEKEVDKYIDDPRCGGMITTQSWVEFLEVLIAIGERKPFKSIRKDLPFYIFAGQHDPVGKEGAGIQKLIAHLEKAGLNAIEHRLYPEGRHEMLNETNRDEVHADIARFVESHI